MRRIETDLKCKIKSGVFRRVEKNERILIWCAGIFDGEGSATINKNKVNKGINTYDQIDVHVNFVIGTLEAIGIFYQLWNGHIIIIRKKGDEVPGGKYKSKIDVYRISFDHSDAKQLLTELLPYLIVKRNEAMIVLEFLNGIERFEKYRFGRGTKMSNKEKKFREEMYIKYQKLKEGHRLKEDNRSDKSIQITINSY